MRKNLLLFVCLVLLAFGLGAVIAVQEPVPSEKRELDVTGWMLGEDPLDRYYDAGDAAPTFRDDLYSDAAFHAGIVAAAPR